SLRAYCPRLVALERQRRRSWGMTNKAARSKLAAVLTTLLAAAGLVVVAITNASTASATPTFASPVVVTNRNISEPGIDVATDGTMYITGPAGLLSNLPGAPSPVYRSSDGGSTWVDTPTSLRANLPGGGD